MAYAILRTAKLKGAGSIGGSIAHAYREREVPNADPERTKDNEVLIPYDAEKTRNDIESARTRSDNVEMVEVVMTTSPEWMDAATDEQKKEFEKRAVEFLEEKFGKENIRSLVWHKDEQTDHLSGHVTPIDKDGHLNAKEHLGGKAKMRELQTEFAEKVKDLGLERGLEGSKARHVEIAKYYARVNEPPKEQEKERLIPKVELPPPTREWGGIKQEPLEDYGQRCKKAVLDVVGPKIKELKEQVEALKKEKEHLKLHTRWSRGKARLFHDLKKQKNELEVKFNDTVKKLERQLEKELGKSQQVEKGVQRFMKIHGPALSTVQRDDLKKAISPEQTKGLQR